MDSSESFSVLLIDPASPPSTTVNTQSHPVETSGTSTLRNSHSNSINNNSSHPNHLSPNNKKIPRNPRSSSKSTNSSSRSRSESRSSDGSSSLTSILRQVGLKVMTTPSFEAALTFVEQVPYGARPILLLVDVDPQEPHHYQHHYPNGSLQTHDHYLKATNGAVPDRLTQANGRHARTASDNAKPSSRARRPQAKSKPIHDANLSGLQFLETVLQGLAKGCIGHVVPVAVCSSQSQDKILELFNMGVADVLIKPIEEQVARTLFLNAHRYSKYRTAITIPIYSSQKNALALPSHARLREVFLKDQWLSDILIHHYCPPPTKISIADFPSMSSQAAAERVVILKRRLLSWDFHPHDLCQDDLMRCVVIVIQEVMKLDGLGDLNIPEHLLHRFVIGLRDSYHRSNPYHNFAHAVDVLQATFYFLCRMGKLPESGTGYPPIPVGSGTEEKPASSEPSTHIPHDNNDATNNNEDIFKPIRIQDFLRPEDIFALVVASIGHDVGHPGVNNMFLVNAHTPLAQVYNDRSVLESFHSMALFQVMKKHGFECFDVDSQNRKFMEFRKMVVSTILATDMGLHFDYVGKIKEQTERLRIRNTPEGSIPKLNQASIDEQERLVLCGTLIKCADISNASRPFHVAERWSAVLLQEMCNQADIEKEMAVCSGGPVPTGPTKNLANDQGMQIDSQLGFIHGFAMPLFSSVKAMIPEMDYCVDLLQINHKIWEERKTEYLNSGGSTLTSLMNVIPTNHSNSLSGPKPSTQAKKTHGRSRTHTGKNSLLPKADGSGATANGDGAHAPKPHIQQARRGPNPNAIANGTESGVSTSSIPRPRLRTKAVTSEGNVVHGTYGSGDTNRGYSDNLNNNPNNNRHHERPTREASRVRSVTSSQSTPSMPNDGTPRTPSGRQTPGSRQSNSRGQKSPGRRNGQTHHNNQYAKDKPITSVGSHVGGLSHLDKVEPIVLGSLLPIPGLPALDHSGSDTSSSIPSSPSLPTSSPSTSPNSKASHPGKAPTPRHPSPLPIS